MLWVKDDKVSSADHAWEVSQMICRVEAKSMTTDLFWIVTYIMAKADVRWVRSALKYKIK